MRTSREIVLLLVAILSWVVQPSVRSAGEIPFAEIAGEAGIDFEHEETGLGFERRGCSNGTGAGYYDPSGGGGGNNWLHIELTGTRSPRDAIGARIRVIAGGLTQTWEVGTSDPSGSMSSLLASFGLGSATSVDLIDIRWPSGTVQRLRNVEVNRRISVDEPN